MTRPTNKLRPKKHTTKRKPRTSGAGSGFARILHILLDGQLLGGKNAGQWLPFVFFLAFLGLVYIGNSYITEKKIRKIQRINTHLQELKFDHIDTKKRLIKKSLASEVAKKVEKYGIKPSVSPPEKIFLTNK